MEKNGMKKITSRLQYYRGVVWYGMVWCGMVWCGMVWYDVVCCDVVQCGRGQLSVLRM